MEIGQILDSIHPLPEPSRQALSSCFSFVRHGKGHLLFRAEKVEPRVYFIRRGIARAYADKEDREVTFWFGKEGDAILSMRSYIENREGYETIELLEECELYEGNAPRLQSLFEADIHIANWGRRMAERELLRTEQRLMSRQVRTATDRYRELLRHFPSLVQRVPLGHIASYLGITQVSLSRIRAEAR